MPNAADDIKKSPPKETYHEAHGAVRKSQGAERSQPTGLIAAISRAIAVQNWDEARRLAGRDDSSNEI